MKDRAEYIESIYKKRSIKLRQIKKRRTVIASLTPVFLVCAVVCSIGFMPAKGEDGFPAADSATPENKKDFDLFSSQNSIDNGELPTEGILTFETESAKGNGDLDSFSVAGSAAEVTTNTASLRVIYRDCYYELPAPFIALVSEAEYNEWAESSEATSPGSTDVMPILSFVINFNISREDFDKANAEYAKTSPEAYNADIIYTFDEEIIKNYYLN